MSLPPLADLDSFGSWPGVSMDTHGIVAAVALLDHVSAMVRAHAGVNWVDEHGDLEGVPQDIPGIVLQVAARVWSNPDARRQSTEGPFSASWDAVGLSLSADERRRVSAAAATGPYRGLGVVSTTRGDVETPSVIDPLRDAL